MERHGGNKQAKDRLRQDADNSPTYKEVKNEMIEAVVKEIEKKIPPGGRYPQKEEK